MTKAKKRAGPRLADPPHVTSIRLRLEELGFESFKEAAEKVGFSYDGFRKIVLHGLAADPKESTVNRLRDLGIYDLVPKRSSA